MKIREAVLHASNDICRRDAETLLAHVLGRGRAWLLARPEEPLSAPTLTDFQSLVARRAAQEPLQYITGQQEFYGLAFHVTPAVLIPRPETEHLVEAVLLWATRFHDERTLLIADVGTGSGAIAIALATHLAGATLVATDISESALALARENAHALGCEESIRFVHGDLLAGTGADPQGAPRFDAIVSNPPYVPLEDAPSMQQEVVAHEPHTALFAGTDGLDAYRRLIPAAREAIVPGGLLALEIGFAQRHPIATLLAGWDHVRFLDDYQGIARVALATCPHSH